MSVVIRHQQAGGRFDIKPGEWRGGVRDGKRTALVCCPGCGSVGALHETHEVASDGTVTPSFWHDVPECGYHEWIRLDGWEPRAASEPV